MLRGFKAMFALLSTLLLIALMPIHPAQAAVAPDAIVYTDPTGTIYRMNPDGTIPMQMMASGGATGISRVVPFPDGSRVLSLTGGRLIISAPDGSNITHTSSTSYAYSDSFAISPDGTKVAFTAKAAGETYLSVYVMDVLVSSFGTPVRSVASSATTRDIKVLDWGTPGIFYRSLNSAALAYPVSVYSPGTGTSALVTPANFNAVDARYSAAANKVAVAGQTKGVTGGNRLFTVNTDGSAFAQVPAGTPVVTPDSVAWAPDGLSVVVSGSAVGDAIYRISKVTVASGAVTVLHTITVTGSYVAYVFWGPCDPPTNPTAISTVDVTGQYSDKAILTATLVRGAGGAPVSGQTVTFKVNGVTLATTGTTDAAGVATVTYPLTQPAGTYTIEASFAGQG